MSLDSARISAKEVASCLHILAAANHRHWIAWERYIIPFLEEGDLASLATLQYGAIPPELTDILLTNARGTIGLVKGVVRTFAYDVPSEALLARKRQQINSWVEYAMGQQNGDLVRWKLQCRTPFIFLSPDQQRSDYSEAERDLLAVAGVGGLVLPDPLPAVEPYSNKKAARRRLAHSFGFHGRYMVSESPWSLTCQACHAKR